MEERLLPINGLLCLLQENDVTRPALAEAGFRLAGLEIPARAAGGGSVKIDCLLFHSEASHLVSAEAKSGGNVENEQALKYGQVDPAAVVQSAYVTLAARVVPTHEVMYVALAENVDRVRLGLSNLELNYPILGVSDGSIRLDGSEQASDRLREVFKDGEIKLDGPPPRLIPFDDESDVDAFKPRVLSVLVAAMARKEISISLTSLAERVMPHFALYGRAAQNTIKKKVGQAAQALAGAEPANYAYVPTNGHREGMVQILRTPEAYDARGRTQAYQAIGRGGGVRRRAVPQVNPDQLDLLAELEITDNVTSDLYEPGEEAE